MRRLALIVAIMMLTTIPAFATDGWTEGQIKSNQIANIARAMGLAENNPIIVESSRIWWAEEEAKKEQAELQAFIDEHYADAVAMAGVMYAEARGLDVREQSMVCWCILNRWDSGTFGSTLSSVIWARSQFAHSKKTVSDQGTDLVWLAQDVLTRWYKEQHGYTNVGRTLPKGLCFYYGNGKHNFFRTKNSGAGSYEFGLENPYNV